MQRQGVEHLLPTLFYCPHAVLYLQLFVGLLPGLLVLQLRPLARVLDDEPLPLLAQVAPHAVLHLLQELADGHHDVVGVLGSPAHGTDGSPGLTGLRHAHQVQ